MYVSSTCASSTLRSPPFVVSTADDVQALLDAVDDTHNGITFCVGSYGSNQSNNVEAMAERFARRTHFLHFRNVIKDGASFVGYPDRPSTPPVPEESTVPAPWVAQGEGGGAPAYGHWGGDAGLAQEAEPAPPPAPAPPFRRGESRCGACAPAGACTGGSG